HLLQGGTHRAFRVRREKDRVDLHRGDPRALDRGKRLGRQVLLYGVERSSELRVQHTLTPSPAWALSSYDASAIPAGAAPARDACRASRPSPPSAGESPPARSARSLHR